METLRFTKSEVMESLKARFRLFNHGSKDKLVQGLTERDLEILGEIDLALPDSGPTRKVIIERPYNVEYLGIGA